ncbi:MAG: flagellar protein FliT [Eubacterium sp.]|nr:flagellar protein FliT [Eubacterium sp.]
MEEQYLSVMIRSLEKKSRILDGVIRENEIQSELFGRNDRESEDEINACIERKGELIDELDKLDEGFTTLFEKVERELKDNSVQYAPQISRMQELIRKVTDQSVKIEAQERQNHTLASRYFSGAHKRVNEKRATRNAADVYRKNMKKISVIAPQFMDRKK